MNQQATELANRIREAFVHVTVPSADSLVSENAGLDGPSVIEHFSGKPHHLLPPRLTRMLGEDLFYMSSSGIHYYLPDFLVYLLTDDGQSEDGVFNQVLRILMLATDPVAKHRFPMLTEPQRTIVSEWLNYVSSHIQDYFVDPEEEESLARVARTWKQEA